jgi:hypothetical protein
MAVDWELELHEYQERTAAKDSDILSLQFQLARMKEQVWHNERDICVLEGLGNVVY